MGMGTGYEHGDRGGEQRVPRNDFCRLLIATRKLLRCDDAAKGIRGVYDPETGDHFIIDEDVLFEPMPSK